MGRPIKFRAWDGRQMLEVESFYTNPYGKWVVNDETDFQAVNPILMQFTGLHDDTGREIYEGDILKSSAWACLCVVEWQRGGLVLAQGETAHVLGYELGDHYDRFPGTTVEVVGNIHENPELSKGEESVEKDAEELKEKLRLAIHTNQEYRQEVDALKSGEHPAVKALVDKAIARWRECDGICQFQSNSAEYCNKHLTMFMIERQKAKVRDVQKELDFEIVVNSKMARMLAYYEEALTVGPLRMALKDGGSALAINPEKIGQVVKERDSLKAELAAIRASEGLR